MKKMSLLLMMSFIMSCASKQVGTRDIASQSSGLTGTYIAVADYKFDHKGPNKAAVRFYFHPLEGRTDAYHVVMLEYPNLYKMAPSYIASNKIPKLADKVGYLNNITRNASAYEAIPGKTSGTFELYPLTVNGDQILPNYKANPRILTLSNKTGLTYPLEGAVITGVKDQKEIFFPGKDDGKYNGIQFKTASFAYKKAGLKSTWRKQFLTGPYLAQYNKKSDVVLTLSKKNGENVANFSKGNVGKMSEKQRRKVFTNPKSHNVLGNFTVSEPKDGMFLFHSVDADNNSTSVVEGRIAMFIDVFDATEALNQDVVELVLVNPNDEEDFLMYYEHPDNGEGEK